VYYTIDSQTISMHLTFNKGDYFFFRKTVLHLVG